jgi:septation ring formation regulator EzrA
MILILIIVLLFLLLVLSNLVKKIKLRRASNKIISSMEDAKISISNRYKNI